MQVECQSFVTNNGKEGGPATYTQFMMVGPDNKVAIAYPFPNGDLHGYTSPDLHGDTLDVTVDNCNFNSKADYYTDLRITG
jgi:hypothetical protein